jgi:hypothetical protein
MRIFSVVCLSVVLIALLLKVSGAGAIVDLFRMADAPYPPGVEEKAKD